MSENEEIIRVCSNCMTENYRFINQYNGDNEVCETNYKMTGGKLNKFIKKYHKKSGNLETVYFIECNQCGEITKTTDILA